ncbi:unannotated protein [freshwater metagenome]|uniref:Unannotated protein n=1 Tax=freshwater metagenome TaxID=449393 RepID=A0A6J6F763_9ZZZZ
MTRPVRGWLSLPLITTTTSALCAPRDCGVYVTGILSTSLAASFFGAGTVKAKFGFDGSESVIEEISASSELRLLMLIEPVPGVSTRRRPRSILSTVTLGSMTSNLIVETCSPQISGGRPKLIVVNFTPADVARISTSTSRQPPFGARVKGPVLRTTISALGIVTRRFPLIATLPEFLIMQVIFC